MVDWSNIHPKARNSFKMLETECYRAYLNGETKTLFRPFEGYRAPRQQRLMLERGTSKADAFQSAHQYGLAMDFVAVTDAPVIPTGRSRSDKELTALQQDMQKAVHWSWDNKHDWDFLGRAADKVGLLRSIKWDLPHVEHPLWIRIKGVVV